ncbi:hypothetical protein GGR51DRAFT_557329 [Nemania sp. FL0031]|nr:hypothetical protein GGR51DRAFT_557329 [Nemania sp. FL0031]
MSTNNTITDNYAPNWLPFISPEGDILEDVIFDVECQICNKRLAITEPADEDNIESYTVLPCGHVFGHTCIGLWMDASNQGSCPSTCPSCRFVLQHSGCNDYVVLKEINSGSNMWTTISDSIVDEGGLPPVCAFCENGQPLPERPRPVGYREIEELLMFGDRGYGVDHHHESLMQSFVRYVILGEGGINIREHRDSSDNNRNNDNSSDDDDSHESSQDRDDREARFSAPRYDQPHHHHHAQSPAVSPRSDSQFAPLLRSYFSDDSDEDSSQEDGGDNNSSNDDSDSDDDDDNNDNDDEGEGEYSIPAGMLDSMQMEFVQQLRENFSDLDFGPTTQEGASLGPELIESFTQMELMQKLAEPFEAMRFTPFQRVIVITSLTDQILRQSGYR